jgi:C_GCAxxG_C_C family probable redox protein
MTEAVEAAAGLFEGGCACSQAVFGAYASRFGLDQGRALRVAAGFGGGMRLGETCGAVTGAFMVLGLAHSGNDCGTVEGRKAACEAVISFAAKFRQQHGSLVCRELLGHDISTAEGAKTAREEGVFQTRCPRFVRDAAEWLEDLLPRGQGA